MEIKLTKDTIIGGKLYAAGSNVTVSDSYGYKLIGAKGNKITSTDNSSYVIQHELDYDHSLIFTIPSIADKAYWNSLESLSIAYAIAL